jgi:two-component system, cell cycle response regulator
VNDTAMNPALAHGSLRPPNGINRRELTRTITQQVETSVARGRRCELLVRIDSANAGQVWHLDDGDSQIGRHPDNPVCVDDQGLSRQHVRIRHDGQRAFVEDLNSSNGTFVNGMRITSQELRNGDTLQLGPRVCFRYTVASENEERMLKRLYDSSVRDPLTKTYNRLFFANQLGSELSFALRHGAELSLIVLDVDHFKKVNDTLGHLAGDAVLKALAQLVQNGLRREDVLARYGGEEFAVLLRGVPIAGAAVVAERLRHAAEAAAIPFDGSDVKITVSLGCASLRCCNRHDPESLVQRADGRLYRAKREGRNLAVWED